MHLVAGLKTRIMKIVREYDIKQIIEFEATDKDKRELVKEILFNQMSSEDGDKLIAEILEDLRATEEEFENRPYLLNAYKTLIESMK